MIKIECWSAEQATAALPQLIDLLRDSVDGGASVGFLPPLEEAIASRFWLSIIGEVAEGARLLLVATVSGRVVGSVQLGLASRPNSLHRAEVQKLLVHSAFRRQGIASQLMGVLEAEARQAGRTLLVLDTEKDSPAETLYAACGFQRVGEIPDYVAGPDDTMLATVIYYRHLSPLTDQ